VVVAKMGQAALACPKFIGLSAGETRASASWRSSIIMSSFNYYTCFSLLTCSAIDRIKGHQFNSDSLKGRRCLHLSSDALFKLFL
jgi:hypothetical protein